MAIIETLIYYPATIMRIKSETHRTKTFELQLEKPFTYIAGQHVVVRVQLDEGFRSSRHYSFSSAPTSRRIEITIAVADGGEVSNWFFNTARVGTKVETTLPLGKTSVWTPSPSPTLLIAGGIGITPLMSMLREHRLTKTTAPIALLYSTRNHDEICFKKELLDPNQNETIRFTLVENIPGDWYGYSGIIDLPMLAPLFMPDQKVYVCGPYGFVAHVQKLLKEAHIEDHMIRTEQFTLS